MGFNEKNINNLKSISENNFLLKSASEKYDLFKGQDPFPNIPSALLNCEDILKYIITTGMVDPFKAEQLDGAVYSCTFSGKYVKYNSKNEIEEGTLDNEKELVITQNSITYLQIEEEFRVPKYMVLRFNLKVSHVYKGLLLGTGPIVDPEFVGHLNIPLHNLTTNAYVIKKGAKLIDVEFTKLSIRKEWIFDLSGKKLLNFASLHGNNELKEFKDRSINDYIEKSLKGTDVFHKEPRNVISVGSSLDAYSTQLNKIKSEVEIAQKEVKASIKEIQKKETQIMFSLFVTVIVTLVPIFLAFYSFQKDRDVYQETVFQYQEKVNELEGKMNKLVIADKQEELVLLKEKYEKCTDKESDEAFEIKKQISILEKEIGY